MCTLLPRSIQTSLRSTVANIPSAIHSLLSLVCSCATVSMAPCHSSNKYTGHPERTRKCDRTDGGDNCRLDERVHLRSRGVAKTAHSSRTRAIRPHACVLGAQIYARCVNSTHTVAASQAFVRTRLFPCRAKRLPRGYQCTRVCASTNGSTHELGTQRWTAYWRRWAIQLAILDKIGQASVKF